MAKQAGQTEPRFFDPYVHKVLYADAAEIELPLLPELYDSVNVMIKATSLTTGVASIVHAGGISTGAALDESAGNDLLATFSVTNIGSGNFELTGMYHAMSSTLNTIISYTDSTNNYAINNIVLSITNVQATGHDSYAVM